MEENEKEEEEKEGRGGEGGRKRGRKRRGEKDVKCINGKIMISLGRCSISLLLYVGIILVTPHRFLLSFLYRQTMLMNCIMRELFFPIQT